MNLKNKPPVLVPQEFRRVLEGYSKAFLMDMAWSFATRDAGTEDNQNTIYSAFLREADAIEFARKGGEGGAE